MIYQVLGQLEIDDSAEAVSYNYANINEAVDFYRDSFVNMAEDITEFGGTFVVTLISISDDKKVTLLKRNCITTTINELYHV